MANKQLRARLVAIVRPGVQAGDPLVMQRVNQIAPQGEPLNPGDLVLAGAFTGPTPTVAGDSRQADCSQPGTVSVRFI